MTVYLGIFRDIRSDEGEVIGGREVVVKYRVEKEEIFFCLISRIRIFLVIVWRVFFNSYRSHIMFVFFLEIRLGLEKW